MYVRSVFHSLKKIFVHRRSSHGFTLFELMLSVGIVAVLGGTVYVSIRPDQLLAQARDSQRIADTTELATLVAKHKNENLRNVTLGATSTLYLSLPAQNTNCSDLTDLLPPPHGFTYHCVTEANIRNVDGTGWLPINLSTDRIGTLPIDPINTAASGSYYVYAYDGTNFELDAPIESDKIRTETASQDGGSLATVYETGSSVNVLADLWGTGAAEGEACTQDSDCADSSCLTLYTDNDGDGYGSGTALGNFCYVAVVSSKNPIADQHSTEALSLIPTAYATVPAGRSTNNTDCNDNNATQWQLLPGYVDTDHDGYGVGTQQQVCSGNTLTTGYASQLGDCDDFSAAIYLGTTRTRYQAQTSACGTYSSASETQTCQVNGVFSGTYTLISPVTNTTRTRYAAVTSACGTYGATSETQTCQSSGSFDGTYTLTSAPSASTRTRYAAVTSACGTYSYNSETQTCQSSGSWSGSYSLTSAPSASTRTRYAAATSACGTYSYNSETQTCQSSGSWSGSYSLTSAPSASTRTRYAAATSACGTYSYNSETQTCQSSGSWSGSYSLTSAPSATTRTMYDPMTSACGIYGVSAETQTCQSSGSFDGTYTYSTAPSSSTRTRYASLSSSCGTYGSNSETQTCQSNGSFNGTYILTSAPSVSTRTAYQNSSVCGGSCTSESQTCLSSGWSGSYAYTSCVAQTASTYYQDADSDGYGNPSVTTQACTQPSGYVTNNTDCNDSNINVYQNLTGYRDADGDTYTTGSAQQVCSGPSLLSGYRSLANGSDCNDANALIWQNVTVYTDADHDGYGTGTGSVQCIGSSAPSGYALNAGDCNDSYSTISPGAGYHTTARPDDGSWDWNCSGGVQKYWSSTYYVCGTQPVSSGNAHWWLRHSDGTCEDLQASMFSPLCQNPYITNRNAYACGSTIWISEAPNESYKDAACTDGPYNYGFSDTQSCK